MAVHAVLGDMIPRLRFGLNDRAGFSCTKQAMVVQGVTATRVPMGVVAPSYLAGSRLIRSLRRPCADFSEQPPTGSCEYMKAL